MKRIAALSGVLALIAVSAINHAQTTTVPQNLNFQSRLAKPDGTPVPDNAAQSVTFRLFAAASGGAALWSQTSTSAVHNGVFSAKLDFSASTSYAAGQSFGSVFSGTPLYLEIQVGADAPLTPRQPLASNVYAFLSNTALNVIPGSVTGAGIASGAITADKFAANIFNPIAWLLGGNSGTNGTQFLGTTDNQPLILKVNGRQAMTYSYAENTAVMRQEYRSVNTLGGSEANSIAAGVVGATIAGGGLSYFDINNYGVSPNTVTADFGAIGGGNGNSVSGNAATVAGGLYHTAKGDYSTVGGGYRNYANGLGSTVAGGATNSAAATYSAVGGGDGNQATGQHSTVAGGDANYASGSDSAVMGGSGNMASGSGSAVAGGYSNGAGGAVSFAAGNRAKAIHQGAFVWSDSANADFVSTGVNQFLIRASGGVGIGTNSPSGFALNVAGTAQVAGLNVTGNVGVNAPAPFYPLSFPNINGDKIELYGNAAGAHYGLGIQTNLMQIHTPAATSDIVFGYGTSAAFTENMRIKGSGNLTVKGTVMANGVTLTSDARYKTNVQPLNNALDDVMNLRGVTYDWDRAKWPAKNFPEGQQIGFIAQELEKIFPQLVATDRNGYKSVMYQNLTPILVEAVKMLKGQLDEKQKQIDALQAQVREIAALKKRVADMEALQVGMTALAKEIKKAQSERK